MNINISDEDLAMIAERVAMKEAEKVISSRMEEIMEVRGEEIVLRAIRKYIESEEGTNVIKKSFDENFIKNGTWMEYGQIGDELDIMMLSVLKVIISAFVFDPKRFKEITDKNLLYAAEETE